ncbi:hypothetical protein LCGC14_0208300 [marine sediment metagenome]|uniref:Uncharacterized protein n=1 Tax=marine sediment metagenome TaxID=412755 RepID=A0A0F9UL21_9ZZZZ
MRVAWGRVFKGAFEQLKWWIVRKTEPWREEKASLDLEWRLFAQKHNAAGHRPLCMYEGMEKDILDPLDKLELYDEHEVEPDCLIDAAAEAHEAMTVNQKER